MHPLTPVPVAILVRVSTNKQESNRQLHELNALAESKGWKVVEVLEETVSGNANLEDRPALKRIVKLADTGEIKKLLIHEVSRLSRRPSVALTFVEVLEGLRVSVYWHAQGIETLLPNGKRNPTAALMLAVLAEMAKAERETLRERIMSGLEQARREGRKLGRPAGSVTGRDPYLQKHQRVVRLLRQGMSIRNIASVAGVDKGTVCRVKGMLGLMQPSLSAESSPVW
jgi:DNA invertase Pin-like site-specific DNA recombinase